MSEFDREKEREKLREQYERDKQKREASERMSELLLQGATMTNRHCKECHSPVFRYDGTEFCPTCQREVADADAADAETNGEAEPVPETDGAAEGRTVEPEPEPESASSSADSTGERPDAPANDDDAPGQESTDTDDASGQEPSETRSAVADDRRPARIDPPAVRDRPTDDAASDGLQEAEATLIREIVALTRRAEETRDVGRKRDLFATAREAAETLQTIRRL